MSYPKVFIIVLQYNHSEETLKCLDSLRELTYPNYRVITVDNASEAKHANRTRLYIEQYFGQRQQFVFIGNAENLGYGAGNNTGIEYALKNNADCVLILNNDTTVEPNLIEKLILTAQSDDRIGIVQAAINENGTVIYAGGPVQWFNPYGLHSSQKSDSAVLPPSYYAIGAAMLITKEVIEKLGAIDEKYFLYYEDADYSFRVHKAGYKIAVTKDSLVRHNVSASTVSMGLPLRLYYNYRNMLRFANKYAPFHIRLILPIWVFFTILKQRIKLLIGKQPEKSRAILKALYDYRHRNFGKVQK